MIGRSPSIGFSISTQVQFGNQDTYLYTRNFMGTSVAHAKTAKRCGADARPPIHFHAQASGFASPMVPNDVMCT